MRYMGIDFGLKRVGVALSDETITFASPFIVLKNNPDLIKEILNISKEKNVEVIVVGESRNYRQQENPIMKEINPFVESLRATGIKVYFEPEFLTSHEAEHIQGKGEMHDASAAALILKSYIESNKNKQWL